MSDPADFEERLAALRADIHDNYRLASGRLTGGNGGTWSDFMASWYDDVTYDRPKPLEENCED